MVPQVRDYILQQTVDARNQQKLKKSDEVVETPGVKLKYFPVSCYVSFDQINLKKL